MGAPETSIRTRKPPEMRRLAANELPDWPRLMQRALAAAYLGVSPSTFDRRFKHIEPVLGIGGNKLWDKKDLDAAVDGCKKSTIGEDSSHDNDEWGDVLENSLQIRSGHKG